MASAYFLHQIKHTNGTWDKGIVVKSTGADAKENYDAALQGYHAYMGAYAYGHDSNTDYVFCEFPMSRGTVRFGNTGTADRPQNRKLNHPHPLTGGDLDQHSNNL